MCFRLYAVREVPLDGAHRQRLVEEVGICQGLRHPNIVAYLGHEHTEHHLRIFLEYVPGGSMASVLSEFGRLEHKAWAYASRGSSCVCLEV